MPNDRAGGYKMTNPNIHTVVASAGTGKTTRIVKDISEEVLRREPEEIIATTFTVKAADELIERSRAKLFSDGQFDKAARLLGARFGTVNSICGQIVSEHAIDLGRSPKTEIIPEDDVGRLFSIAANAAIEQLAPTLNALADMFGASEPKQAANVERSDWRTTVRRIIELARANGLAPSDLMRSGELSIESFLTLLSAPAAVGVNALDSALLAAIETAIHEIPAEPSKTSSGSIDLLHRSRIALLSGDHLSWPDWARLSKVTAAKKDGQRFLDALGDVSRAASQHSAHPRLRENCVDFIEGLFRCAAQSLEAYQTYKAQRGVLDFIDQEALALRVLTDPTMSSRLSERIGRVYVDEFQDSSPLQIAIFTALADLVDASTWVGDPKQAIYGFRNADSALTQAAFAGVAEGTSEQQEVLSISWRSRPGIVDFVNEAFSPAFSAMGLSAEEHKFSKAARSNEGFLHSPLAVWWLDGNREQQFAGLAAGVRDTLAENNSWTVSERSGALRPIEAGDIAILCRSHADINKVAEALNVLGIPTAVEREGLARTLHVEFVMAAVRWTADPSDRLALAELVRFFSDDPTSDAWLQAISAADQEAALRRAIPISDALAALHDTILALTPAELLDAVITIPEVTRRIELWADAAMRFEDLEALRGFARSYEATCASSGTPATASGMILALAEVDPKRPKSQRPDAVKVMTYWGAKGLEWPLVVLTGLDREPKARLFEPVAEAQGELDWHRPLTGRWIRYWPWPYGAQSKDTGLDATALAARLGQEATLRAREEETRLLYVGVTRARDYVVFAPATKTSPKWLQVLNTNTAEHLVLPKAPANALNVGGRSFPARISPMTPAEDAAAGEREPTFVRLDRPMVARPALRRRPSSEAKGRTFAVVERVNLGPRLPITGKPDMQRLGEAVHAILAVDAVGAERSTRLQLAQGILDRWLIHEVAAVDVLSASDRLARHIGATWPKAVLRSEIPVFARLDQQLISGRIDLLLQDEEGFAVIDHKSFPGSRDQWEPYALGYGPQLALYAEAVSAATGTPCDRLFIHLPLVGSLLRIAIAGV
jgi:ATP-dependent helicase/nuclease subunit A